MPRHQIQVSLCFWWVLLASMRPSSLQTQAVYRILHQVIRILIYESDYQDLFVYMPLFGPQKQTSCLGVSVWVGAYPVRSRAWLHVIGCFYVHGSSRRPVQINTKPQHFIYFFRVAANPQVCCVCMCLAGIAAMM